MQLSHAHWQISARFDDPNLVSCAGLVPVAALARRAGLVTLLERLGVPAAHAATKVIAIVLGMVAGADSITDLDLLRHGAMRRLFTGVRAPSTLGTFLRGVTFSACAPARRGRLPTAGRAGGPHPAAARP